MYYGERLTKMGIEVVVVPKLSKFEWDMQHFGLSESELIHQYKQEGVDIEVILGSHKRQKQSLEKVLSGIKGITVVDRADFPQKMPSNTRFIITLGGDNHFLHVARFVDPDKVVIGMNSDLQTSHGGLLEFNENDIPLINSYLDDGQFNIQSWSRMKVTLNGELLPYRALGEVFMGDINGLAASRALITYRGKSESQSNSGLLVCTGSGLTGWYSGATKMWDKELLKDFPFFEKTADKFRFISREPFKGELNIGDLEGEEELLVTSLNSYDGILAFDSEPQDKQFRFPFPRGSKAVISLDSEHPLRVAVK